ncbi:DUF5011 domain-containing protein, partial [Listeria booriae]|uniref:DUF5011 domain-containing protein n=1 Tax=Listeria booriae TaxID=1552123 RepID=UPI0016231B36
MNSKARKMLNVTLVSTLGLSILNTPASVFASEAPTQKVESKSSAKDAKFLGDYSGFSFEKQSITPYFTGSKTGGTLNIAARINAGGASFTGEKGRLQFQVPAEFKPLFQKAKELGVLNKNITGHLTWGIVLDFQGDHGDKELNQDRIEYDSNSGTFTYEVPGFSLLSLSRIRGEMQIDFGKMYEEVKSQGTDLKVADSEVGYSGAIRVDISEGIISMGDKFHQTDFLGIKQAFANGDNNPPTLHAPNKTIKQHSEFNPMEGVTAEDIEDGNITNQVEIVDGTVDVDTLGQYLLTYRVTDSNGATTYASSLVTVSESNAPVINATDKTITVGDTFNKMEGVTATDIEDGDITSSITTKGDVDTTVAGKYIIEYSVMDSDQNIADKFVTITVKARDEAPVINASDKEITVGDAFNPMEGVTATDKEDGDITGSVRVEGEVDTSTAGTYAVKYSVTDSANHTTEKTINVTVKEKASNESPVINASDKEITVGDAFNPMEGVTATDREDGDLTSSVTVKSNNVDTAKPGTYNVIYTVMDKDGNTTEKTINVTVKEKATQGTINPLVYTEGDLNIKGTYTGDVKTVKLFVNGEYRGIGGTFENGNFTYYAQSQGINAGQNVYLVALDKNGK